MNISERLPRCVSSSYYKPRYELLFTMSEAALKAKTGWDQRAYAEKLLTDVEEPWQLDRTSFPVEPEADAVAVSKAMHAKYGGGGGGGGGSGGL